MFSGFRCQLRLDRMKFFIVILALSPVCVHKAAGQDDCLKLGVHFYEDIGCPKKTDSSGCPSFQNCKYERPRGGCLYRGHKLRNGERVPQDSTCNFGCFCNAPKRNKGGFTCAQGSCASWAMDLMPGCYFKKDLDQCCPHEIACESSGPIPTCNVDGNIYREGEGYTPNGTCLTCLCTYDYNGKHKEADCRKKPCDIELRHSSDLEKNCAPVYYQTDGDKTICCPDTVICPSAEDTVLEDKPLEGGKTCKYGKQEFKQGRRIQRIVHQYGVDHTVICECLSPPWLTCTAEY